MGREARIRQEKLARVTHALASAQAIGPQQPTTDAAIEALMHAVAAYKGQK